MRRLILASLTVASLALAGCSTDSISGNASGPHPTLDSGADASAVSSVAASQAQDSDAPGSSAAATSPVSTGSAKDDAKKVGKEAAKKNDVACENAELDLVETRLGYWLNPATVTVPNYNGRTGILNFRVTKNEFDPCAPLSHVVVRGRLDDGLEIETVLFFAKDHFLPQQKARFVYEVVGVDVSGTTAMVNHYSAPNDKGFGNVSQAKITLDGDTVTDSKYDEWDFYLDFTRDAPPTEGGGAIPRGNKNFRPWDHEIEGDYTGNFYGVPIKDEILKCVGSGVGMDCTSYNAAIFPATKGSTVAADKDLNAEGKGSGVHMEFAMPYIMYTHNMGGGNAAYGEVIADEAVTKMSNFIFDTRGDNVRVIYKDRYFEFGNGVAETGKQEYDLDTSRWPKPGELRSWQ